MHQGADGFSFLSPERVVRLAGIREGMVVADFHAGSGFVARAAARAVGPTGVVWAIDPRRDILARLKNTAELERLANMQIVRGNIEQQGGSLLPEQSMDVVFLVNALFACHDKEAVLEEVWRVLKKTGHLAVVDWRESFGGLGPHPLHVLAEPEAKKMLVRGGFLPDRPVAAGDYHWGMLLRKKP